MVIYLPHIVSLTLAEVTLLVAIKGKKSDDNFTYFWTWQFDPVFWVRDSKKIKKMKQYN